MLVMGQVAQRGPTRADALRALSILERIAAGGAAAGADMALQLSDALLPILAPGGGRAGKRGDEAAAVRVLGVLAAVWSQSAEAGGKISMNSNILSGAACLVWGGLWAGLVALFSLRGLQGHLYKRAERALRDQEPHISAAFCSNSQPDSAFLGSTAHTFLVHSSFITHPEKDDEHSETPKSN